MGAIEDLKCDADDDGEKSHDEESEDGPEATSTTKFRDLHPSLQSNITLFHEICSWNQNSMNHCSLNKRSQQWCVNFFYSL